MKKVMFVFGTRPEAIKMAPVILEMQKFSQEFEPIIVLTGQHRQMLDQVMKVFGLKADHDLKIMEPNQSITQIITKSLEGLEKVVKKKAPDLILVQGDTATVFAAGLIAYFNKIPLGHVEAGLRTFDKWQPFPEEMNRRLTTPLADLHFAPTKTSVANLRREHVPDESIFLTGNTVIDALLCVSSRDYKLKIKTDPKKKLILVTTHRRESFGEPLQNTLRALVKLSEEFSAEVEIILPVHQNPNVKKPIEKMLAGRPNIHLVPPLDYEPFVHLMKASYLILSDSGGVQEEAPSLGKPVLILREKTERPDAVDFGTVKLVGTDYDLIMKEAKKLLTDKRAYDKMSKATNPYGDGKASPRIVQAIRYFFKFLQSRPEEFKVN
ncbi:UDP-N-acetylglucosamine 2-epimerase (non-hydrolyzing) [Candidatus Saganbacteria bacterium CG08_land_8_20_14_0_20_45_16]|uniref:UDP-N-acetylglucosamine 2-epimerase (non-hydrolyzing) n=1 Tax=Candidatus Saganbacteria bacterium CG08_land_8_20_14_0_20_45_16 TaxID=2014293 RepID=A0A2H0XWG5_UNCSA|nr:MAG: UDP-N-acetylglucosamine 2-epimerase (non-hydrolyzing) [Candidatus Saganbacteria bacterium CG08_land_8_20_14_0_20_45_16]